MAERKVSDVELERLLANDLPPQRARELEQLSTDDDRARLAELKAEHAAFLASVDVAAEAKAIAQRVAAAVPTVARNGDPRPEPVGANDRSSVRPPRAWWRWALSGGALAAAAAVAIVLLVRTPGEPDVIVKGDVALVVHLATDTGSRPLANGDLIERGARLRFEVTAAQRGFVAVVGRDGAGGVTVYYPYAGRSSADYDPSTRLLPGAIQLDATPGDEHVFALYAERPFALDLSIAAIRDGTKPPVAWAEVVLKKK